MDANPPTPTPPSPPADADNGGGQPLLVPESMPESATPQSTMPQSQPPPQSTTPQSTTPRSTTLQSPTSLPAMPRPAMPPSHSSSPPLSQSPTSTRHPLTLSQSPVSSPGLSRPSPSVTSVLNPATPQPEDAADDYFDRAAAPLPLPPTLPQPPSRLSSYSTSRFAASPPPPDNRHHRSPPARPDNQRRPSIRIRFGNGSFRSSAVTPERPASSHGPDGPHPVAGRARSASQSSAASAPADSISPARNADRQVMHPDTSSPSRNPRRMVQASLPRLTEEGSRPTMAELGLAPAPRPRRPSLDPAADDDAEHEKGDDGPDPARQTRLRRVSRFFWPNRARRGSAAVASVTSAESRHEQEYREELVDWLDIIDPEVQALSTLTNVQNSLFVPDLGTWVNRRPTYVLSQHDLPPTRPATAEPQAAARVEEPDAGAGPDTPAREHPPMQRTSTITSRLSESHYASLPHGRTLDGWSAEDKQELDDRVRHMLHSRRSKFRRAMKGFGQYVRRPLGFFVTLYALLITLFGLAWVLFLIGWIYVGEQQVYAIHVIDSVLVALFAIMGDGLAPFRAIDTYHMIFVLRYSRIIKNASKPPRLGFFGRRGRPEVRVQVDPEDRASAVDPMPTIAEASSRPDQVPDFNGTRASEERATAADDTGAADVDAEDGKADDIPGYHPLNAKQVKSLLHHQKKLAKSHSFYKPQETHTHFSFPLNYLVAIVILLDFHSCLQISLGACTWGIDYHVRPFALTTVILCVSITCNLTAGLVITIGDRRTRKKDVIKLLDRQELTGDAIARMEHKKEKKEERRREAILERIAAA